MPFLHTWMQCKIHSGVATCSPFLCASVTNGDLKEREIESANASPYTGGRRVVLRGVYRTLREHFITSSKKVNLILLLLFFTYEESCFAAIKCVVSAPSIAFVTFAEYATASFFACV